MYGTRNIHLWLLWGLLMVKFMTAVEIKMELLQATEEEIAACEGRAAGTELTANQRSQNDKGGGCLCDCGSGERQAATTQPSQESQEVSTTITTTTEGSATEATVDTVDATSTTANTIANTDPIIDPFSCPSIGNFPHPSDCHQYYVCASKSQADGSVESVSMACPPKQVFNVKLDRCSRDLSTCTDAPFKCSQFGRFPDTTSNSSYYWCVQNLFDGTFHLYHVDCRAGQVFVPVLGKCFIDINNLESYTPNFGGATYQPDDEDLIEAELKQFKAEEKARLKQEKLKQKLEDKFAKELAKKTEKDAKEKAKSEKFMCSGEGLYASSIAADQYVSCVSKKGGKFKAVRMQCPAGQRFEQAQGGCL